MTVYTLPKTNIALNIGHLKRKLAFQPSIFRCYASFSDGNYKKLQTCLPSCSTTFKQQHAFVMFTKSAPHQLGWSNHMGPSSPRRCEYEAYQIYQIHKCRYRILFIKGGWEVVKYPLFHHETHLQKLRLIWSLKNQPRFQTLRWQSVDRFLGEDYLRLPEFWREHKFCNLWEMTFTGHLQGSPTVLGESSNWDSLKPKVWVWGGSSWPNNDISPT